MNPATRTILAERLASVRDRLAAACQRSGRKPEDVTLVAVTKTVTPEVARIAFELGLHDLGESRPQELWKKAEALPQARWHMIGHLQRNKLDRSVPLIALLHSVDSERLLDAVNQFGQKRTAPVSVLLEVNCSGEQSKGGFEPEAMSSLSDRLPSLLGVSIQGLMTMAALSDDLAVTRSTFQRLRQLRDSLAAGSGLALPHLSMGMSGDFEIAIEEGATFVRLGTVLFEGLDEE